MTTKLTRYDLRNMSESLLRYSRWIDERAVSLLYHDVFELEIDRQGVLKQMEALGSTVKAIDREWAIATDRAPAKETAQ